MLKLLRTNPTVGVIVLVGLACLAYLAAAPPANISGLEFATDGKLKLPDGYRQWVYVGGSVTPNDLNDGHALFPEFHSVYMDPQSFAEYKKSGKYRDGTVFIKELAGVGGKEETSGKGYFMGDFNSLEVAVKDSARFKGEPGNWAYFSFDYKHSPKKIATSHPTAACNKCHQENGADDFVFSQDYPVLRAAAPHSK